MSISTQRNTRSVPLLSSVNFTLLVRHTPNLINLTALSTCSRHAALVTLPAAFDTCSHHAAEMSVFVLLFCSCQYCVCCRNSRRFWWIAMVHSFLTAVKYTSESSWNLLRSSTKVTATLRESHTFLVLTPTLHLSPVAMYQCCSAYRTRCGDVGDVWGIVRCAGAVGAATSRHCTQLVRTTTIRVCACAVPV